MDHLVSQLALAKLLKPSKKFVLHSSGPSSAGGGGATPALARALNLFDSGSYASDAEPTNLVPPQKRPRKSPIPKTVLKPSKALTTKGTLEQFLFLHLSYSYDIELFLFSTFVVAKTVVASTSVSSKGSESRGVRADE
jgi:hypothetical protein